MAHPVRVRGLIDQGRTERARIRGKKGFRGDERPLKTSRLTRPGDLGEQRRRQTGGPISVVTRSERRCAEVKSGVRRFLVTANAVPVAGSA